MYTLTNQDVKSGTVSVEHKVLLQMLLGKAIPPPSRDHRVLQEEVTGGPARTPTGRQAARRKDPLLGALVIK